MKTRAYIGLGSNLDDPPQQLQSALQAIAALPGIELLAISGFYRSPPMGPSDQPEYCNAVCSVQISIDAAALMDHLLEIERAAGRVRGGDRWGPRRIDLDLLHVEGVSSDTIGLRLPHPGLAQRNFVLVPLARIAPDLQIPGLGRVVDAAERIGGHGLSSWAS